MINHMILAVCANPSVDSFWSLPALGKGTTNRSKKETYYPGGKGIHAGFALNELGKEVTVLGIWGGQTGAWLKKKCKDNGISTIGPNVEQWNRLCLTMKSDSDWNETELLGQGPCVGKKTSEAFWTAYNNFIDRNRPQAVIICGSVPEGLDHRIYHRLVTHAEQHNISTFVDASGPLLRQTLDAHPYSIHVNLQEGRELCDYEQPGDIARWLSRYCKVAAVTDGDKGLYLWVDKQLLNVYYRLDPSKIISTVGAGDCLFAGLCFASLEYKDPGHWAKYAAACGTANCINPSLGMLKKKDVDVLFGNVKLKKLKT